MANLFKSIWQHPALHSLSEVWGRPLFGTMNVKMEHLFKTVDDVKGLIDRITSQTEEVKRKQSVILSTQNKDKKISSELEHLNKEIKKNSSLVQARLKAMQSDIPTEDNCQGVSVFQRIYKNQHSHLTRCFVEVMRSYYRTQTDFREKCKAQIQRQLEIVDKETTDEELEEMLNGGSLSIFITDMKCDSRLSSQALSEMESRHFDLMSLESSIRELHELFTDIALLVETQGELMNNIEKNVMATASYVDNSKIETDKAIEYKKSSFNLIPPILLRSFRKHSRKNSDQSTTKL